MKNLMSDEFCQFKRKYLPFAYHYTTVKFAFPNKVSFEILKHIKYIPIYTCIYDLHVNPTHWS